MTGSWLQQKKRSRFLVATCSQWLCCCWVTVPEQKHWQHVFSTCIKCDQLTQPASVILQPLLIWTVCAGSEWTSITISPPGGCIPTGFHESCLAVLTFLLLYISQAGYIIVLWVCIIMWKDTEVKLFFCPLFWRWITMLYLSNTCWGNYISIIMHHENVCF